MIHSSNRSEWFITITVILRSDILPGVLAFAIGGNPFRCKQRRATVPFPDITGIKMHSLVKYPGANAGAVSETRPTLPHLLADLKSTAATLDAFANRAEKLIKENEQPINRTTRQLERAVADLRVTSAYAKTLAESLLRRPQQIIWGTRREPNEIPAPEAILRD